MRRQRGGFEEEERFVPRFGGTRHKNGRRPSHFSETRRDLAVHLLYRSLHKEFRTGMSGSANPETFFLAATDKKTVL